MAEKTFHFGLTTIKSITDEDVGRIAKSLKRGGFESKFIRETGAEHSCFLIYLENYKFFLEEAKSLRFEKLKISKRSSKKDFLESFAIKDKYYYFLESREKLKEPLIKEMELYSEFKVDKRDKFYQASDFNNYQEYENLFDDAEKIRIIYSLLRKVKLFSGETDEGNDFYASEKIGFKSMIHHYTTSKILKEVVPLHGRKPEKKDSETIKKYFGESTAIYFYFLDFLNKYLLFAGIVGLIVFVLNKIFHENVLTSPYESIFSAFMIFWMAAFTASWEKRERQLAVQWRSFGKSKSETKIE
jgi:hypothetical protein